MTPPLPAGTLLLHIGPPKTGTSTIQSAFHDNRPALDRQHVRYVGRRRHSMAAAMAAARGGAIASHRHPRTDQWQELLDEIAGLDHETRAVLSSEALSEAGDAGIDRILQQLGRERTHVVVTLRPFARILTSQWQQFVQNAHTTPFPLWLDEVLGHRDTTWMTPAFWRRHRYDCLVRRWAALAGPDNVTVIALDPDDPGMVTGSFERLLALEPGTLVPAGHGANRSLTFPETEVVRAVSEAFSRRGWSSADWTTYFRFGALWHLQEREPDPDEEPVLLPPWAVDASVSLAAEMAAGIRAEGTRVIGDLDDLARRPPEAKIGTNRPIRSVPEPIAAALLGGVARQVLTTRKHPARGGRAPGEIERAVAGRRRGATPRSDAELDAEIASLRAQLARPRGGRLRRLLRRAARG